MEGVVNATPRPIYPGNGPVLTVLEVGWTPGPVWKGAENFAPSGFDPRTVKPVASCITNSNTPAHNRTGMLPQTNHLIPRTRDVTQYPMWLFRNYMKVTEYNAWAWSLQ